MGYVTICVTAHVYIQPCSTLTHAPLGVVDHYFSQDTCRTANTGGHSDTGVYTRDVEPIWTEFSRNIAVYSVKGK